MGWEEEHKEWYENFKKEQEKLERHMKRARIFGLCVLIYLGLLVATFIVSLFVPAFRDTSNLIFLAGNFISLGLVIWSLWRLKKFPLPKDRQSIFLFVIGAIAIIINIFTIYNHFYPFI